MTPRHPEGGESDRDRIPERQEVTTAARLEHSHWGLGGERRSPLSRHHRGSLRDDLVLHTVVRAAWCRALSNHRSRAHHYRLRQPVVALQSQSRSPNYGHCLRQKARSTPCAHRGLFGGLKAHGSKTRPLRFCGFGGPQECLSGLHSGHFWTPGQSGLIGSGWCTSRQPESSVLTRGLAAPAHSGKPMVNTGTRCKPGQKRIWFLRVPDAPI